MQRPRSNDRFPGRTPSERLLIHRYPILGSGRRATKTWWGLKDHIDYLSRFKVGDTYEEKFSTTSPPASVYNTYIVTRIDRTGVWGKLTKNRMREYTGEEMR